jgi:hypothetical protein
LQVDVFRGSNVEVTSKSRDLYLRGVEYLRHRVRFNDFNGLLLETKREMEVPGTNSHFVASNWKFPARTSISSAPIGSSRRELPFHRLQLEVPATNFHFVVSNWNFPPRTSISSPPIESSRHELPFHLLKLEVPAANFHFIAGKYKSELLGGGLYE